VNIHLMCELVHKFIGALDAATQRE
jgi:hypothetical protein